MTGVLFLATVLLALLAVWTRWTIFYGFMYVGATATVIALVVSFVTREREPRGAHSQR